MITSLQNIGPEEIQDFFKHICFVVNEHKERENAREELHKQIKKIKTAPKKWIFEKEVKGLHEKVGKVLTAEKKLLSYKDDTRLINQLNDKIKFLEGQLARVKGEKDEALFENRGKIEEIQGSIGDIKSRMHTFIRAKEERDKRLTELEKKVKIVAK